MLWALVLTLPLCNCEDHIHKLGVIIQNRLDRASDLALLEAVAAPAIFLDVRKRGVYAYSKLFIFVEVVIQPPRLSQL
jgi:hypothetical protein